MITLLSLNDPIFWLSFLYFGLAVVFAFFIPGNLLIRPLRLSPLAQIVLSIIVGLVLWGWQGMVFGYLGIRWLSYVYLLMTFSLWLRSNLHPTAIFQKIPHFKFDWLLVTIIALGTFVQVNIVWFNGTLISQGLYFCCGNSSDNLFHIALTNQIIQNFPPYQPGMYGTIVQNYHYWSNIVVAELVRVFGLPLIATQFQYSTIFISLFLGLTALIFGQIIKIGRAFTAWLLFFLYFSGDLIFLLLFYLGKGFNFSLGSLEDGAKFLENPPRAVSIIVFFAGISLLTLWLKRKDLRTGLLMALVLGSVIGFKVYTGLFALIGLAFLGIYFLLKKKIILLIPLIVMLFVSLIVYLPVNTNAGGLYFTGFWRFENFIVQPIFGLEHLELARKIYADNNNWIRLIQYELHFFLLFVLTIFGSKLFGLIQTKKSLSLFPKELNIFLLSGLIVSSIAGFFFQQTSGGANTFNFLVSLFIIGSLYAALACFYWIGKLRKPYFFIAIIFVVLLTIPRVAVRTIENIQQLQKQTGFIISSDELQGYTFLNETEGEPPIVLVDKKSLVMSKDSPYVSFLIQGKMYITGEGILESHGINIKERSKIADTIFTTADEKVVRQILVREKIDYLILQPKENLKIDDSEFLKTVFENNDIKILEFSQ